MEKEYECCPRCRGNKKMYKIGENAYSSTNSGGIYVDCPMCLGKGRSKTLTQILKEKNIQEIKDLCEEAASINLPDVSKKRGRPSKKSENSLNEPDL